MAEVLVRQPESSGDGMVDECRTRRRDLEHNVVSRADDEGWNASAFDHVSNETDGLMTKGSVRDQ